ncbi:hypothetical protein, partial [Curtobacterium sp. PsM8]|uniref:hypothetical protein n=1 Tax=Curtobacterium sp. PsM8 TaxID=3030532 RepID=UPI00263A40F5
RVEVIPRVLHEGAAARSDDNHAQTASWLRSDESNHELRDGDARKRADLVRAARGAFVERGETPLQAAVLA